jgi:hypothetical protein
MIFATPFDGSSMQCTGPSSDAGFASLEQVREVMGEPYAQGGAFLVYGGDVERVLFSRIPWSPIASTDNND